MGACSSKGGSGGQLLNNETDIKDLNKTIKNKVLDINDTSKTKMIDKQSIEIDYTIDKDYIPLMAKTYPTFNILGFKSGTFTPYGCTFDISQISNLKMTTLKTFSESDSVDIWNDIKAKLTKDANAKLTGNNKGLNAVNGAINDSEKDAISNITNILTKSNKIDVDKDQKVTLHINTPARCGPNGKNPQLNQDAQIDILITDIVTSTVQLINKSVSDKGLDSSLDISDSDWGCTLQMIASVICSMLIIYLLYLEFGTSKSSSSSSEGMGAIMAEAVGK